jgi:hypothetical protein
LQGLRFKKMAFLTLTPGKKKPVASGMPIFFSLFNIFT